MAKQSWLFLLVITNYVSSATIKDIFTIQTPHIRVPRDNKPYLSRYGTNSENLSRTSIKPEENGDNGQKSSQSPLEKRCIRCDTGYLESPSRYPSYNDYRSNRYDDRRQYRGDYDRGYNRYDDRGYNRYDDRYDRDKYYYDRYDDRYDPYRYSDRDRYDRYDRGGGSGGGGGYDYRDRYNDRGTGYDNRGYDYRDRYDRYDRDGYRPWDETYRGTSGFDNSGRGYYYASGGGHPDYYGGGYASNWNYRDDYRDRGYGGGGSGGGYYGGGGYRRDPYDGYRGTSYLYGRPSTTTIQTPLNSDNNDNVSVGGGGGITQQPLQDTTG